LKTVLYDIRFGLRQLIKMPGFTLTAIISLALGIGATTAVFSVVYAILMDPYPYKDPDRMVHLRLIMPDGKLQGFLGITRPEWQQLKKSPVVEDAFLQGTRNLTISGGELPEDVVAVDLSSNSFNFLGVPVLLGRPAAVEDKNTPQLQLIRYVQEHTKPTDTLLDGWTGLGVFRPHAFYYSFFHSEVRAMLTDEDRSELLSGLEKGTISPELVFLDRNLRAVSPSVTAFLKTHYEPVVGDVIWKKKA